MKTTSQIITTVLIICLQFLCIVFLSACKGKDEIAPASKIRAAYWKMKSVEQGEEQLRLLRQHGFNTALVADGKYRLKEDLWQGWGEIAGKYGMQLFPVLLFAVPQELKGQHLPYTNRYGTVYHAMPCPLDAKYWNAVIGQRFEQLAFLSKSTAITGVVFDTEMYGSDFSIYSDPCFCDVCWQKFIDAQKASGPGEVIIDQNMDKLSKEQRFDMLIQHRLFRRYITFQQHQLQKILVPIEQQIHQINSDLSFGFLGYRDNWFYTGLIQGFGTASRPVLIFSESTYVRGYTPYVTKEKMAIEKAAEGGRAEEQKSRKIPTPAPSQEGKKSRRTEEQKDTHLLPEGEKNRRQKVEEERKIEENTSTIAQYIPGLWLGRFFPQEIPSQLYTLARHTDGYWVYSADNLWDTAQPPRNSALHGSKTAYWTAFKKVNDELKHFTKTSDFFQSAIPHVPHLSSFYDTAQNCLVTQLTLKLFLRHIFSAAPQDSRNLAVPAPGSAGILPATRVLGKKEKDAGKMPVLPRLKSIALPVLPNFGRPRESDSQNVSEEITYRDKTLFHCLKDGEGMVTITHIPAGKYDDYTYYRFFDSNGFVFHEGFVDRHNRLARIPLPANISGLVSLLIDSGIDAARVSFAGLPFVIEASNTFPLTTVNTAHMYAFYVKPEKKMIKLRAYCPKDETVSLTIQSSDDTIHQKITIIEFTEISLPLESHLRNTQDFWTIAVTPVPSKSSGEIRFYFYDEEFPYLIPNVSIEKLKHSGLHFLELELIQFIEITESIRIRNSRGLKIEQMS